MAEQLATPRITAAYLDNFVGRVVMLVGKVTQLRGDQATLDSEGTVTVLLNRVIGKVNPDLSIKVLTSRDLGTGVDHGPCQSSRAYVPRVAMVWTSPADSGTLGSPIRQRQAFNNSRHRKSNATPDSTLTETITSKPLHDAYLAAQRLQRSTRSNYGSRPNTAMSFTTSSSERILGRELELGTNSPYPSHISPTPTPSLGTLLPSPPEEAIDQSCLTERPWHSFVSIQTNPGYSDSQETYDEQSTQESHIPSAQPYTPLAYSPPLMSSPSQLPSPPMTQPRDDFHLSGSISPAFSTSSELTGRRFATTASQSKAEDHSESALFDAVLDGIGRIHVSMGRDNAGRWRIKRASDERP
ncbi:single-stranded DNA binding protein [Fusarium heterosporum]|uniref:Single-stranded DNA binding protein n=1 Tax=Fusarium heterosporum TaxID=42747 RepID=A0A8H5WRB0_FUSHE|nr:single-stranded DNA binding protein [Fusarium heterosporum]